MGDGFVREAAFDVLYQLNLRFGPGEQLMEMVTIQKEFQVFSQNHSLQQSYRLLHIGPSNFKDREIFYKFLERLKKSPSDINGVNGHDRIVKARQEDLESSSPLPIHTKTHLAAADKRVTVTRGQPIPHENQEYIIISTPTMPSGDAGDAARPAAAARQSARRKSSA
jgi:hypothetical protein